MNMKLLGTAVAAALIGLSSASFGQGAGGAAGTGPSGQDTAKDQSRAATPGSAVSGSGTASGSATSGSSMSSDCDKLTGSARTRCERQHSSASGSTTSGGAPVTKQPAQSGPGTVDRDAKGKPGGGTNSSGSN